MPISDNYHITTTKYKIVFILFLYTFISCKKEIKLQEIGTTNSIKEFNVIKHNFLNL